MHQVVAGVAVQLAHAAQQRITRGRLFGQNVHMSKFSTKPWSKPEAPGQLAAFPRRKPQTARRHRGIIGDRCSLVVVAFKLLQSLLQTADKGQLVIEGADMLEVNVQNYA